MISGRRVLYVAQAKNEARRIRISDAALFRKARLVIIFANLIGIGFCLPSFAQGVSILPDPGLSNPKLRFHTGKVVDNAPELSPTLPDIPGDASPWYVVEWGKHEILSPDQMSTHDVAVKDPLLGAPLYTFGTSDNELRLSIYQTSAGNMVYELAATGGELSELGGSNLFLAANASTSNATFDNPLTYSLDMKVSKANVTGSFRARRSGAVGGQILSGFVITYKNPSSTDAIVAFVQLEHANSGNNFTEYRSCSVRGNIHEVVYNDLFADETRLQYIESGGFPTHMEFVLNRHLCQLISAPLWCLNSDGTKLLFAFPKEANLLTNWRLVSTYVGLETETRDLRNSSQIRTEQGTLSLSVQLSNLTLLQDQSRRSNSCPFVR